MCFKSYNMVELHAKKPIFPIVRHYISVLGGKMSSVVYQEELYFCVCITKPKIMSNVKFLYILTFRMLMLCTYNFTPIFHFSLFILLRFILRHSVPLAMDGLK